MKTVPILNPCNTSSFGPRSFTREEEKFINYLIDKKVAAAREGEGARVVAAVIHRHGEKTNRSSKVLKEESKEGQVWFALGKFMPDAPISELHDVTFV